jgi:hypothetical protein
MIPYFPLIRHGSNRKRRLQQFFFAAGTSLPNYCLAAIRGIHTETDILLGPIYAVIRWDELKCHGIYTY